MLLFELFQHDPEFVEIKEGDTLFQEGDPADVMYVLVEGKVEVSIGGVFFGECSKGDILGEMGVIDASPRHATITARTYCKFVILDKRRFQFLVDETPGFAIEIIRIMAHRLRDCDMRFLQTFPQITIQH
jgi:CRP-like cAMP-binding protein